MSSSEKTAEKSTENLQKATKDIKETGSAGFEEIAKAANSMFGLGSTISSYITAQITSGTLESQMNLFHTILDFLESEKGKFMLNALIEVANVFINGAATLINLMDHIINFIVFILGKKVQDYIDSQRPPPTADIGSVSPGKLDYLQNMKGGLF